MSIVQWVPEDGIRIPIIDASSFDKVEDLLRGYGIDEATRNDTQNWLSDFRDSPDEEGAITGQIRFISTDTGLAVLILFVTLVSARDAQHFPQIFDSAGLTAQGTVVARCQLSTGDEVDVVRLVGIDNQNELGRNVWLSIATPFPDAVIRFTGETVTFGREDELTRCFVEWVSSLQFIREAENVIR